jgi:hypothetical protein
LNGPDAVEPGLALPSSSGDVSVFSACLWVDEKKPGDTEGQRWTWKGQESQGEKAIGNGVKIHRRRPATAFEDFPVGQPLFTHLI